MAKKKTAKPARFVSKQQLSTWEKQKKRQRLINFIGLSIIAAVVVLLGVGWFATEFQPMHKVAIRVNDTTFTMQYYIDMLAYRVTGHPEFASYVTDFVVEDIVRSVLIREGAAKLDYTVSDKDVISELKKNKEPTGRVQKDVMRTRLLTDKMLAEYFDPKVPATEKQRHLMAMFLEGESQAAAIRNRINLGDSFADLAQQFSLLGESKTNKGDFGWHPLNIFVDFLNIKTPAEWGFSAEIGALSLPLYDSNTSKEFGYWIIRVLERDQETEDAHVQAILVGSLEDADKVRARLMAGEDFATVARAVSLREGVKENGGDLGPIPQGKMSAAFDKFAFDTSLPLNTFSPPIRDDTVTTNGGYWLVKVVAGEDNRKISDEDRNLLKGKLFDDWVSELLLDPANRIDDSYLDDEKKAFAASEVMSRR